MRNLDKELDLLVKFYAKPGEESLLKTAIKNLIEKRCITTQPTKQE